MIGRTWTDDDRTVEFEDETLPDPVRDESYSGEGTDGDRLLDDRPPHWD